MEKKISSIKKSVIENIKEQLAQIETNTKEIKRIEKKSDIIGINIIELLKPFIKEWKPEFNEKAVWFHPYNKSACYVWFVEQFQDLMRFRELPYGDNRFNNYMSFDTSTFDEDWDSIILPLEVFIPLNQELKAYVMDKSKK